VFKSGIVVMVPDGDPQKHRATIKTSKVDMTLVLTRLFDFDLAASVCQDLVKNEGVQSIILCPGFTNEAVAKMAEAVGPGIAVNVARGDVPSVMTTGEILGKEGWFTGAH
jgi:hypothetical protein